MLYLYGRPENDPGRKMTQVLKTENVPGFNFLKYVKENDPGFKRENDPC